MTKNGDARNVPLSKKAKRLLSLISADQEIIVPVNEKSFRRTWRRVFFSPCSCVSADECIGFKWCIRTARKLKKVIPVQMLKPNSTCKMI